MTETEPQTTGTNLKTYTLNIEASVTVPADAKEIQTRDGRVVGFELPGGVLIKPWIVFEQCSTSDEDDSNDLTHDELTALGVEYEYETREFVEEL
jgi:hypothetical protein